jgi:hypothetical protein
MDLDRWVNENNPDEQLQYSKGWWGYIELIRRLMYKFGAKEAHGIAIDLHTETKMKSKRLKNIERNKT